MTSRRIHTKPPACDPVYDNDGNVEYYVDCKDSTCPGSDHYSAANPSSPN